MSSVDEDLVVHEVLAAITDAVRCEKAVVLLADQEDERLRLHTATGAALPVPLSEPSVVRRIFGTGRAEIVNDLVHDPDYNPRLGETLAGRQLVGAPMIAGGRRLGVVAAVNAVGSGFDQRDLDALAALAPHAALSIENVHLRTRLHRQGQELGGLYRLARLLITSETVDAVVSESVRIVADLLDCERVVVLLRDEDGPLIAHPAAVGASAGAISRFTVSLERPSLIGTVFRTGTPLTSNEAKADAWVDDSLRELLDVQTILVAPLASAGRAIGVLCAINAHKGMFDPHDTRLALLLGSRIGSVIEAGTARERERALVQRLREMDHTKSEFVSMLAHELKSPMSTIVGFAHILKNQWPTLGDEQRDHIVDILARETTRLSRLVGDLLDLSRMEAGTLRYDMETVVVHELVKGLLDVHTSLSHRHTFDVEVPADLPPVWGDADRLRQVMLNLVSNATRHSPEGSTVTISAARVDIGGIPMVRVAVSDQGIGILPEDQERIFGKFVTLEKPSWVPKGTGLGLYITHRIVQAHGGRMWVESEPGEGTTISFSLPAAG